MENLENKLKQLYIDYFASLPPINNSIINGEDIFNRWSKTSKEIYGNKYIDVLNERIRQMTS